MKRSILLILLVVTLAFCKNKDKEPQPVPEMTGIVGKWRLVSTEYVSGDSTIVQTAAPGESNIIAFRYDGILLNEAGQAACCAPSAYVLNGVKLEIKQVGDAPPINPQCSYVDCWAAREWKLTQEGDSLTVEVGNSYKAKYVKVV
jgi:hypothetical protein